MKVGIFDVANTRGVCPLKHRVRVSLRGELLAEIYPAQLDPDAKGFSDPLRFVRRYPFSQSRKEFTRQLEANGIDAQTIRMLLDMPEANKKN
jgi:hypothetical protein